MLWTRRSKIPLFLDSTTRFVCPSIAHRVDSLHLAATEADREDMKSGGGARGVRSRLHLVLEEGFGCVCPRIMVRTGIRHTLSLATYFDWGTG